LLLAALWVARGPLRRLEEVGGSRRAPLEGAVVLLLMLLLSPMSSKAHFGVLVLPGFLLARTAAERGRLPGVLLAAAVALALVANKDPLGERLYTMALYYSTVTGEAVALLAGCLLILRRQGCRATAAGHFPGRFGWRPAPGVRYPSGGLPTPKRFLL